MIFGLMDRIVRNTDSPGGRNAVASGPRGNHLLTDSQEAAPTAKIFSDNLDSYWPCGDFLCDRRQCRRSNGAGSRHG